MMLSCLRADYMVRERESSEGFRLWGAVGEREGVFWEVGLAAG